jgi:hypothetical protein
MKRVLMGILMAAGLVAQTRPAGVVEVGGANLPAQEIGPNDLIAISVYDAPEFTRTVRVAADGQIRLPMLKQRLRAEGLLPAELESAIAQALKNTTNRVDETMPGSRRCFSRTSLLRLPGGAHAPCAAARAWLLERWQPV